MQAADATVGYLAGDGVMLFWNDPLPCEDYAGKAVRTALDLVAGVDELNESWRRLGYEIGVGIGVANGYATIGMMGFDGRYDYSALGPVVNVASRLSDEARNGNTVLINQRTHAELADRVEATELDGGLMLKGFPLPTATWSVTALDGRGMRR